MVRVASEIAVKQLLKCSHGCNVTACSVCNELVPTSFWNSMIRDRFTPEPNTYHVTTLTNCLAKAYFDQTSSVEETLETAWAKLRGSLLHYVVRSLGWSELRAKMTFQIDDQTITIVGYIDAYDPETATIYDLKTTRLVKWQDEKRFIPRENHAAQLQCYQTLLEEYAIPVNRLVLIYVDDKNIVTKKVPSRNRREWMIKRATVLHKSLTGAQLPTPEPSGSCKYCPHVEVCPQDSSIVKLAEALM